MSSATGSRSLGEEMPAQAGASAAGATEAVAAGAGEQVSPSLGEPGLSGADPEEGGGEGRGDAAHDVPKWEGCKENIKPLKRGRTVEAIAAACGGGLGGGGGSASSSARVLADLKRCVSVHNFLS